LMKYATSAVMDEIHVQQSTTIR